MKIVLTIIVLLLAILACGCTATAPATAPAPHTPVPDLVGTWTGSMLGYDEGVGFSDYPNLGMAMVVTEQHGRIFSGYVRFMSNGTESTTEIAGVVGRDDRTFTIVEQDGGYCLGEIIATDEIEMTYMQDGSPYSIAVDSFRRE
jgi:ABC-type transport system substrate-binding protein